MSSISTDYLKIQKNLNFYKSFFDTNIYIYIGKMTSWSENETDEAFVLPSIEFADQSFKEELKDIIALKRVSSLDVCLGIKRYNWVFNSIYDAYSSYDNFQLKKHLIPSKKPFYVITDEYNVYKCINNNKGNLSKVKPTGQFLENITLSDGYIWKFMYNVPEELRVKFLSTQHIPILDNSYNFPLNYPQKMVISAAVNGTIDRIEVVNPGQNYTSNAQIFITGDGLIQAVATPIVSNGRIIDVKIVNPGAGYTFCNIECLDSNAVTSEQQSVLLGHIAPIGGHGYNSALELGAFYSIVSVDLIGTEQGYFPLISAFRKIGLIYNVKNLRDDFLSDSRYYGPKHPLYKTSAYMTTFPEKFIKKQTGDILFLNYILPIFRANNQLERLKLIIETL